MWNHGILILSLLSSAPALSEALVPRAAAVHYTTITTVITTQVTYSVPVTIDTQIDDPGVKTLIPNLLTLTIQDVPAYVYLETFKNKVKTKTLTSTKRIKVTNTATAPPVSNTASTTPSVSTSPTKKSKSSSATASITSPTTSAATSTATSPTKSTVSSTSTSTTSAATTSKTSDPYATCFQQGSPKATSEMKVFDTFVLDEVETCSTYCSQTTACQSYSWTLSSSTCTLYSGSSAVIKAGKTGVYFANKNDQAPITCIEAAGKK